MRERTEILANSLTIVLSVCLVVAAFEASLAVGLIDSPTSYPKYRYCQGPDEPGQFHPQYGFTRVPNQQYLVKRSPARTGNWTTHTINSAGFRDTYNTGERTAIVLGDSFTEGLLADDNATYPHLLDRWAQNRSYRNYGTGGYGTATELLVYENVSADHSHDLVILGYYLGNDMRDNVEDRPDRPGFAVENGSLVQERPPLDEDYTEPAPGPIQSGPLVSVKGFLIEHTESYLYLTSGISGLLQFVGLVERDQPEPPTGETLARQTRVTRLLLDRVADEARRHNATLLVVGIPQRGEVNPENPSLYLHADAERYANHQREMIANVVAANANAHYLDLKPTLVAEREEGNRVYGIRNGHMTEYGYRVTARTIHRWLVDHDEVATRPSVNFSETYDRDRRTCP